jgi:hypothetical protein
LKYYPIYHWFSENVAHIRYLTAGSTTYENSRLLDMGNPVRENPFRKPIEIERGKEFLDFLSNTDSLLVVSEQAKTLLESQGLSGDTAEYFPIQLLDRRGKKVQKPYWVVNLLRKVHCLAKSKSRCRKNDNPDLLGEYHVDTVVLIPKRIPPDAVLFRLGEAPGTLIIRSDLLTKIRRAKLQGLAIKEQGQP